MLRFMCVRTFFNIFAFIKTCQGVDSGFGSHQLWLRKKKNPAKNTNAILQLLQKQEKVDVRVGS